MNILPDQIISRITAFWAAPELNLPELAHLIEILERTAAPQPAENYLLIAAFHERVGAPGKAAATLQRALRAHPANSRERASLLQRLGILEARAGDDNAARAHFEEALLTFGAHDLQIRRASQTNLATLAFRRRPGGR